MAKSTTFRGAPKPFGGSGHFDEPVRHSLQAQGIKTGHLAERIPLPEKLPKITNPEIRSVYLGKQIRAIFEFEDMDYGYLNSQLNGLNREINESETFSIPYITEKMENILRDLDNVLSNFERRVQDPEIRAEWNKFYADWQEKHKEVE